MIEPHTQAPYTEAQLYAVRALFDGQANEGQQKAALEWILWGACAMRDPSYRPGDGLATAFAEGKRFAGLQIAHLRTPQALEQLRAREALAKPQRRGRKTSEAEA